MDQRQDNIGHFLLRRHLAVDFAHSHLPSSSLTGRPGLVDPGRPLLAPPASAPTPTSMKPSSAGDASSRHCNASMLAVQPEPLPPQPRLPPRRTLPYSPTTVSLARCQQPAIQHVGNVGMGVSRPQQATTTTDIIGIEDAVAVTVHRLVQ
ncbi:hypothetical protein ACLOJK_018942 [Asimina triloba]